MKNAWLIAGLLLALAGCGFLKQTVRTVHDLAVLACELFAADHEDELAGLSPAEFCAVEENLRPFIEQITAAQQTAGAEVGLGRE